MGRRHRARPTSSARSPTSPRSSRPPTAPAPGSSSTPCTSPRIDRIDITARRAATPSSPARTSGTARTPVCCGPTRHCSTRCRWPRCARRPTVDRGAGRPARRASRPSPPSPRPPGSCSTNGLDQLATAEATVFAPLLDGLLATPGVRVWGPTDAADAHAYRRLHGRRPDARRRRRRARRATASPRGPVTRTRSRSSTSSDSPTPAAWCERASSRTSNRPTSPASCAWSNDSRRAASAVTANVRPPRRPDDTAGCVARPRKCAGHFRSSSRLAIGASDSPWTRQTFTVTALVLRPTPARRRSGRARRRRGVDDVEGGEVLVDLARLGWRR